MYCLPIVSLNTTSNISEIHTYDFTLTNDLVLEVKNKSVITPLMGKKLNYFPNLKYAIENEEKF